MTKKLLGVVGGILNMTDCLFTAYAVKTGFAVELNPLVSLVIELGFIYFIFLKVATSVAIIWLASINNKISVCGLYLITFVYLLINIYEIVLLFRFA